MKVDLKNKTQSPAFSVKQILALVAVLSMFCGFLFGRAFLSMGMLLFGMTALWGHSPKTWWRQKYWLLGCAWVLMYGLSFFWSDNVSEWQTRFQVKLPVLLLPLSFALLPAFSKKQIEIFTLIVNVLLLGGLLYSLSFFLSNYTEMMEGYGKAKVVKTPVYGDHIRFSLAIALTVIWNIFYAFSQKFPLWKQVLLGFFTVAFVIGIHLLAVRTGLLTLYIGLMMMLLPAYKKWGRRKVLFGLATLAVTFFFLIKEVPSIQQKINYTIYSFKQFAEHPTSINYSDIARIVSMEAGWAAFKSQPFFGVGAGDLVGFCRTYYQELNIDYPNAKSLLPHNQILVVMGSAGLFGTLIFLYWLVFPLLKIKGRSRSMLVSAYALMLIFALLFEPMLEVQFGVFVFVFFMGWAMHYCRSLTEIDRDKVPFRHD